MLQGLWPLEGKGLARIIDGQDKFTQKAFDTQQNHVQMWHEVNECFINGERWFPLKVHNGDAGCVGISCRYSTSCLNRSRNSSLEIMPQK